MPNSIGNRQGFTLIELLIVVAIIGILAAVAIPQLVVYRIRGFNAAAISDLRNVATAQEALYTGSKGYGGIVDGAVSGIADASSAFSLVIGPRNGATATTVGTQLQNALGSVPFSLSNKVAIAGTNTISASPAVATSYVIVAKHALGTICFGRDSDATSIYKATYRAVGAPMSLASGDVPIAFNSSVDFGLPAAPVTTGKCGPWTIE